MYGSNTLKSLSNRMLSFFWNFVPHLTKNKHETIWRKVEEKIIYQKKIDVFVSHKREREGKIKTLVKI